MKIFTCSLLRSQWCKMELKTFFRWSGNCFLFGFEEETQPYKMTFVMSAMAHRIWMSNDQFWRKIPLVLQEVVAKMQVLMNGQQRQHKRLFCLHQRTVVENPTKWSHLNGQSRGIWREYSNNFTPSVPRFALNIVK